VVLMALFAFSFGPIVHTVAGKGIRRGRLADLVGTGRMLSVCASK